MKTLRALIAFVITLTLTLTIGEAPIAAAQRGPHRELPLTDVDFIDTAVAQRMDEAGLIGVTVSVVLPDRGTLLKSYGLSDLQTGAPLLPADHYRIASVTKTFTATAILELVDRHRISLDDKLSTWVKGIPNGDKITVRQMLAMQSGIFNLIDDDDFIEAYNNDPLLPWWMPEIIVEILQRHPPNFEPGARTEYSDSNYILLGLILEAVTGQTAEQYITKHVIGPLGLHETSLPTTPELPPPFSHGYDDSFGELLDLTYSNPTVPWTGGGMVSTVPDMTKYAQQLAKGALITPRLQRERLQFGSIPNNGPRLGYGLGLLQVGDWIGHDGAIFGYSTAVFFLPKTDATIVVMVNKASTTLAASLPIFFDIASYFYPDSFPH